MSETDPNNSSWFNPWWKGLFVIAFFPITLSYLIWKQKWQTPAKIGAIVLVWIVFIAIGSNGSKETNSPSDTKIHAEVKATPTPAPTYTLEQKQTDFKQFYEKYQGQSKGMLLLQARVIQLSNDATSKEELYLQLENVSQLQSGFSRMGFDLKVPESLKEYKELSGVSTDLGLAAGFYQKSIDSFKTYLNKSDLQALSDTKRQTDAGTGYLNSSMEKMDHVAKELGVDLEQLKKES